ncbi:MAG TPA: hypothetical protein VGR16_07670 [Thermomicrobiales bacterium]|nr:hypothetical protein [Thermomicrobiales bacterium]
MIRAHRSLGRFGFIGALIIFAMLAAPIAALGLQQGGPESPSPAQGHGQVIAQGVATVPGQAAWRVVRDTAEPLEEAAPEERALGFALAGEEALIVNDLSFGTQDRLAAGEASFVPSGVIQQRASAGSAAVDYYRIALVPAEQAGDAGGDELLFASDTFGGPSGGRDIDLVRDVLSPDEETDLAGGETPSLLFVTSGEVTVEQDGDETLVLDAGEAGLVEGDATLTASGAQTAEFVVGVVGPEVPPIPRFTGSVTIQVRACPPGMTAQTLDASACDATEGAEGFEVNLLDADGNVVETDDTLADGELIWPSIPFGTYTIDVPALPSPFDAFLVTDADGVPTEDLTVTISAEDPDALRVLFNFQPEEAVGTITLQVRACPEGMTPETLAGDFCDLAPEGYAVQITESATGEVLTLADATVDGGTFVFSGLTTRSEDAATESAEGIYTVTETELPPGYSSFVVVGADVGAVNEAGTVVLTEAEPDAGVTIYNFLVEDSVATPGAVTEDEDAGETPTEEAATDETGIGSVTAQLFLCPEGSTPNSFDASSCTPANGDFSISLYGPDDMVRSGEDAAGDANTVTWTDLPAGNYFVEVTSLPPGYDAAVATGAPAASNNPNAYMATVTEGDPDVSLPFYLFPAA